ncbi:MAG: hypothetical protein GX465_14775 [Acidobacteria bacterium]|jgi:hypothetical protein|nr:hypothetical protein [Acidobacteriota bacterium]
MNGNFLKLPSNLKWEYYDRCLEAGQIQYQKGKIIDEVTICDYCQYKKAKSVTQEYDEVLPNGYIWQTGVRKKIVGFYCPRCKDYWGKKSKSTGILERILVIFR